MFSPQNQGEQEKKTKGQEHMKWERKGSWEGKGDTHLGFHLLGINQFSKKLDQIFSNLSKVPLLQ